MKAAHDFVLLFLVAYIVFTGVYLTGKGFIGLAISTKRRIGRGRRSA